MRFLTTDQAEAISDDRVRMCYLVEASFDTGPVYFSTATWTMFYNGIEWLGAGSLLDIQLPDEDSSLEAHECLVSLDGLDPAVISLALNEDLEGRAIRIYGLVYDPDTNQPIGHWLHLRGTVSQVRIISQTDPLNG